MPPDLHRKDVKVRAIDSAGFLVGLAQSDQHKFTDEELTSLWRTAYFLATLADRPDLIPAGSKWAGGGGPDHART